jgi:hypothetical protein
MILLPFPSNTFVSLSLALALSLNTSAGWDPASSSSISNDQKWTKVALRTQQIGNLLQLPISNNDDGGRNLICTSSREPEIPEVKNTQKTRCNQGRNQALCFFFSFTLSGGAAIRPYRLIVL